MKTYTEKDGFTFQYDPQEKILFYPQDREVSEEVIIKFKGYIIQLTF